MPRGASGFLHRNAVLRCERALRDAPSLFGRAPDGGMNRSLSEAGQLCYPALQSAHGVAHQPTPSPTKRPREKNGIGGLSRHAWSRRRRRPCQSQLLRSRYGFEASCALPLCVDFTVRIARASCPSPFWNLTRASPTFDGPGKLAMGILIWVGLVIFGQGDQSFH